MPVKRKIRILEARYVKEAGSIAIIGECQEGKMTNQINKSCFSFGDRTENEIDREMEKTADMMVGKEIYMVFDPELNGKIKDNFPLKY